MMFSFGKISPNLCVLTRIRQFHNGPFITKIIEKRMICQDHVVVVRIMLKIVLTVQDAANELANEL